MKKYIILTTIVVLVASISQAAVYDDAIGYWQFEGIDEQLVLDSTSNGNDLYFGNSVDADVEDGIRYNDGLFGKAMYCPWAAGMASSVTDNNAFDFQPDDAFSIATWVKNKALTSNTIIVSKQESSGNYRGYSVAWQADGSIQFIHRSQNSVGNRLWVRMEGIGAGELVDVNNWVHLAVTYDGSRLSSGVKFYLNGFQLDPSIFFDYDAEPGLDSTDDTINDIPFVLGGRNTGGNFGGYLDEAAVWGRKLSAAEVKEAVALTLPAVVDQNNLPLYVMEQGETSDTFDIVLTSLPSDDVIVTVTPINSDVNLGSGQGTPVDLTFTTANWDQSQQVTVNAVDDIAEEGPHYSSLTFSFASTDSDFAGRQMYSVRVYIEDNDVPGIKLIDADDVRVDEAGPTSDTYSVVLLSEPTDDVVITATDSSDPNQVTIVPESLTFTTANWFESQDFTVTVIHSDLLDTILLETTIVHSVSSLDAGYDGFAVDSVTVDIGRTCTPPYLPPDLNMDCHVDFEDLASLVGDWLECTEEGNP